MPWFWGDDLLIVGDQIAQDNIIKTMSAKCDMTVRAIIGPEPNDAKHVRILNRYVTLVAHDDNNSRHPSYHLECKADPTHAELIVRQLGLDSGKSVTTPGVKRKATEIFEDSPAMSKHMTTQYRSIVMRTAYLGVDRPDMQFSTEELAIHNSEPTEADWLQLKRLG